eukprot:scaffold2140_cov394-Prasinococcus_capsulatus_cf.AAC.5
MWALSVLIVPLRACRRVAIRQKEYEISIRIVARLQQELEARNKTCGDLASTIRELEEHQSTEDTIEVLREHGRRARQILLHQSSWLPCLAYCGVAFARPLTWSWPCAGAGGARPTAGGVAPEADRRGTSSDFSGDRGLPTGGAAVHALGRPIRSVGGETARPGQQRRE